MVAFRSYSSQEFGLLGVVIPVLTVRQEVDVFEIIAQLLDQLAHSTELFFRQKLRISIHVAGGWRDNGRHTFPRDFIVGDWPWKGEVLHADVPCLGSIKVDVVDNGSIQS